MDIKELMQLKIKLVEEIYENTQNQMLVVSKEDEEELLINLIMSRANLIEQLNNVNQKLSNIELSDDLKELNNSSNIRIKEIVEADAKILETIKGLEISISDKLRNMKKARNVVTKGYMNYAGSEQQPAYYIDKKK